MLPHDPKASRLRALPKAASDLVKAAGSVHAGVEVATMRRPPCLCDVRAYRSFNNETRRITMKQHLSPSCVRDGRTLTPAFEDKQKHSHGRALLEQGSHTSRYIITAPYEAMPARNSGRGRCVSRGDLHSILTKGKDPSANRIL